MKSALNAASRYWRRRSLGLFLIRVVTGAVFLAHGWGKLQGMDGVVGYFGSLGIPAPGFFAPLVAWAEVVGGVALILGLGSRIAGVVLGLIMLAAVYLTGIDTGWAAHELELMLMASSFGIALIGSGWISLWRLECSLCGGMMCSAGEDCPKASKSPSE